MFPGFECFRCSNETLESWTWKFNQTLGFWIFEKFIIMQLRWYNFLPSNGSGPAKPSINDHAKSRLRFLTPALGTFCPDVSGFSLSISGSFSSSSTSDGFFRFSGDSMVKTHWIFLAQTVQNLFKCQPRANDVRCKIWVLFPNIVCSVSRHWSAVLPLAGCVKTFLHLFICYFTPLFWIFDREFGRNAGKI